MDGMDEMDPEMAAALAASMMDAPAGAVGGSFGGGGVPMMTEASSTAALEALAAVQSAVLGGGEPGEMGALLDQCRDAYETKKWHELTNLLGQAYKLDVWDASAANRASLVQLYNDFVFSFWEKMNRKRLAHFMTKTATCIEGVEERFTFLQDSSSKLLTERTPDEEAVLLVRCEMARIILERGDAKECKRMLEELETKLNGMTGCQNRTYSCFYWASASYYKASNNAEAYFKAALQYLGYEDMGDLSPAAQSAIAFEIGKAALLGEKVFNFGELLVHPIMASLEGTPQAWMSTMLTAFNAGDVAAYRATAAANAASMDAQADLVAGAQKMEQKITILALMTLVFKRAGDQRILTFEEIVEATGGVIALDAVEFLVMKAVCIGVIDATIDQVAGTVAVTRVQPRVLTPDSIEGLAAKLESWCATVKETLVMVEGATPELLA